MRVLSLRLATALAALFLATAAHAELYARDAMRILAQARAATGGAGWNALRGIHETGVQGGVRYEMWIDPLRYGVRLETQEPAGRHVRAFNGLAQWEILTNGVVTGGDDHATQAVAKTWAFFLTQGYFFFGRFDARGSYEGVRRLGGRTYDAVGIQPKGGKPWELWFDRKTHLLSRVIDRSGGTPLVLEVSDYRKVGPVKIAFRYEPVGATPKAAGRMVESVDFRPADRALFSLPAAVVERARR